MFVRSVLFTLLFGCCCQLNEGLRILAIFPHVAKSHFTMSESLVRGLAAKGHQVDVYSHYPSKKSIPNYTDYSLAGSLNVMTNKLLFNQTLKLQLYNVKQVIEELGTTTCELMNLPIFQNLLKNALKAPQYDIIITELFTAPCYLAWRNYLNVPIVGLMTTSYLDWYTGLFGNPSITNVIETSTSYDACVLQNFWQRFKRTVTNQFLSTSFKYNIRNQNALVKKIFGPNYPDVIELCNNVDLILINMHSSINGILPLMPSIVPVAGLHIRNENIELPQVIKKWLDDSNTGCIYFSFGSVVRIETLPEPILKSFYDSFKNIAPVRVLMKISKPEELPPGLPSNVMTQSWLAQEQVLKHENTKAFITHGGLMGTQESIYYGVPMIGCPLFGDQYVNMERFEKLGIAILLPLNSINEESLTTAIKEILHNSVYKKNILSRSNLFKDRPMNPLDTAIYWIEFISRQGKDALRSPYIDMYWWQIASFDIYFCILIICIIICFIFKLFVIKICKLLFFKSQPHVNLKKTL